jgi:hypothetical protein
MVNGEGKAPVGASVPGSFAKERAVNLKSVAFCALAMMASPAAAQSWGPYGPGGYVSDSLSLHEIRLTLRWAGLRPVTPPVRSGQYYVLRAVDRSGGLVRVVMDPRYGNILSVVPLPPAPVAGMDRSYGPYPARPYEPDPRYGALQPDSEPSAPPPPPGGPNAQRPAPGAQEHRSAAVTPSRPPLPRPRPASAATVAAKPAPETPAEAPSAAPAPTPPPPPPATTGTSVPSKSVGQSFPPAASLE